MSTSSLPEAETLASTLTPRLSTSTRVAAVIDRALRSVCTEAFEALGHAELAAELRSLAPVVGARSMLDAEVVLSRQYRSHTESTAAPLLELLLRQFEHLQGELEPLHAAFMAIELSRHLHGDDRLVDALVGR